MALALVTLALPARADVPPSPYSPDSACTLEAQCAHGTFCPYSWKPGQPRPAVPDGEACRSAARANGLERRCRHGGNYAGQELFCPKGETGTWKPPPRPTAPPVTPEPTATATAPSATAPSGDAGDTAPPKPASRCAVSADGGDGLDAVVLLAAALTIALRRRSMVGLAQK